MSRKAKPWAVVVRAAGDHKRTEHTSRAKAYVHAAAAGRAAYSGASNAYRIHVERWDHDHNWWALYDTTYERVNPS